MMACEYGPTGLGALSVTSGLRMGATFLEGHNLVNRQAPGARSGLR